MSKVYNLIILDESGSMGGLEKVSVDGVNETIQTIKNAQKNNPAQEQFLTFATFSHRMTNDIACRVHRDMEPIANIREYTMREYHPDGMTPLFDAMGMMLTRLECKISEEDVVLVTIITDGYENSSVEYNASMIRNLITRLSAKNWIFAYIGANQDAILAAQGMGIKNAMNFDADEDGSQEMWRKERESRCSFFNELSACTSDDDIAKLKEGYFRKEKE